MLGTIIHYISVLSPYVCGFWAIFYMFISYNEKKNYLLERCKIREILKNDYNIDLDKDVFSKF